jgi:hypothetical protein
MGAAFLIVALFMILISFLFFLLYLFFLITNLDNLVTPGLIFSGGSFVLGVILLLIGTKQLKR